MVTDKSALIKKLEESAKRIKEQNSAAKAAATARDLQESEPVTRPVQTINPSPVLRR